MGFSALNSCNPTPRRFLSNDLADDRSTTTAAITSTGFVLPGISFGITPVGFYMFSAYWAVFTAVMLWGAFQKRKVIVPRMPMC